MIPPRGKWGKFAEYLAHCVFLFISPAAKPFVSLLENFLSPLFATYFPPLNEFPHFKFHPLNEYKKRPSSSDVSTMIRVRSNFSFEKVIGSTFPSLTIRMILNKCIHEISKNRNISARRVVKCAIFPNSVD